MRHPKGEKEPARQLALDLASEPRFGEEDFLVSPSNEAAYAMIESWPNWQAPALLIVGPTGSGKSHLAAIWAARAGARIVTGAALGLADLPALGAAGAVLVEDAEQAVTAEAALFHLFNLLRELNGVLVLTAKSPPDAWGLTTPDLLSRLRLAPMAEMARRYGAALDREALARGRRITRAMAGEVLRVMDAGDA